MLNFIKIGQEIRKECPNTVTGLGTVCLSLGRGRQLNIFVRNVPTEFHENPTNDLVIDTR
jgi:hypothetical protein